MSAKWCLEQAIQRIGGEEQALQLFPTDIVYAVKYGKTFHDLPLDVLAVLLSHIKRKHIFVVIRVCKAWYEAFKKPQFWKKHIDQALDLAIFVNSITDKQQQTTIRMFNTFYSPVAETLREQVEWIFHVDSSNESWVNLTENTLHNSFITERRTFKLTVVSNWIYRENFKLYQVVWYIGGTQFDEGSKRYCRQIIMPRRSDGNAYCTHVDVPKYKQPGMGKFINNDTKMIFEGQIVYQIRSKKYVPHGFGKWTFEDSTVLEGDGVAHMGEPRFIMDALDWRDWKKRKIAI